MAPLLSPEYQALNRQLHVERKDYGAKGATSAPKIVQLARQNGLKVILDYGCGKGTLKPAVEAAAPELTVLEYDPAIPGKDTIPEVPVDIVAALDVMEHVEPDHLDDVLRSMAATGAKCVYMLVATSPASKILADGRNAHLIVQPKAWWQEQFGRYFKQVYELQHEARFIYIGATRRDIPPEQLNS